VLDIYDSTNRSASVRLHLKSKIDTMVSQTQQVMKQTKARIFGGDEHFESKLLSVFETSTDVICKGKASKPTEFGKMVKIQEAENQIVIDFEVYDKKPNDSDLLIPSIKTHQELMGRTPHLVAADAGFYSAKNEAQALELG
jgi:transposase, IS5 family